HDVADRWTGRRRVRELESSHAIRSGALRRSGRDGGVADRGLSYACTEADDEGIANHECSFSVGHATRPIPWEAIQPLKFARRQSPESTVSSLAQLTQS